MKRFLFAAFGLFGLSAAAIAQQPITLAPTFDDVISFSELRATGAANTTPALTTLRADVFSTANGSPLIHGLPTLVLLDGRRLADSSAMSMGLSPLNVVPLPFLQAVEIQKPSAAVQYGSDAPGGAVNLLTNRINAGGEAGVYYGHSVGGSGGGDDLQSYIIGGVGNDQTQISAGASYEHSSLRFPR